jgi:hypothetical protein
LDIWLPELPGVGVFKNTNCGAAVDVDTVKEPVWGHDAVAEIEVSEAWSENVPVE